MDYLGPYISFGLRDQRNLYQCSAGKLYPDRSWGRHGSAEWLFFAGRYPFFIAVPSARWINNIYDYMEEKFRSFVGASHLRAVSADGCPEYHRFLCGRKCRRLRAYLVCSWRRNNGRFWSEFFNRVFFGGYLFRDRRGRGRRVGCRYVPGDGSFRTAHGLDKSRSDHLHG